MGSHSDPVDLPPGYHTHHYSDIIGDEDATDDTWGFYSSNCRSFLPKLTDSTDMSLASIPETEHISSVKKDLITTSCQTDTNMFTVTKPFKLPAIKTKLREVKKTDDVDLSELTLENVKVFRDKLLELKTDDPEAELEHPSPSMIYNLGFMDVTEEDRMCAGYPWNIGRNSD